MNRVVRAFISVLLLVAAGLGAGCGSISDGKFSPDRFWEKAAREAQ